jgi:N-acylneuraminate cytidylyltransferase
VKDIGAYTSRQSAPVVYDMNASFYFYKKSFFDYHYPTVFTPKTLVYKVPHICFDIDEPLDFEIMNFLLRENKIDINF